MGSKLLSCKRAVNLSSSDSSSTHYNCPSEVICPHIGIDLDLFLDLSLFSLANWDLGIVLQQWLNSIVPEILSVHVSNLPEV